MNTQNLKVTALTLRVGQEYTFCPTISGLPTVCTEIDESGTAWGPNPDYPHKSDIKIIVIGDVDDLNNKTITKVK